MFLAAGGMEAECFAQPSRNQSCCVCVCVWFVQVLVTAVDNFFRVCFVPKLCDSDSHACRLTDGPSCVFG